MIGSGVNETPSSKRCSHCNKKTIVLITCPCTNVYCLKCRYPELHNCTYDYLKFSKQQILKENPVITGEKLCKI